MFVTRRGFGTGTGFYLLLLDKYFFMRNICPKVLKEICVQLPLTQLKSFLKLFITLPISDKFLNEIRLKKSLESVPLTERK